MYSTIFLILALFFTTVQTIIWINADRKAQKYNNLPTVRNGFMPGVQIKIPHAKKMLIFCLWVLWLIFFIANK